MTVNNIMYEAIFCGGCFWSFQKKFSQKFRNDIKLSEVGYIGGIKKNPSYEEVCSGKTGHTECLRLKYTKVSYRTLLEFFFTTHDFTKKRKTQYKSAIFFKTEHQKKEAIKIIKELKKILPVATEVLPYTKFYKAEEYHQFYLDKLKK